MTSVAVVVPGLFEDGGVPSVARFVLRALRETGRYRPSVVALPMSSGDPLGVRLSRPATWAGGPRARTTRWDGEVVYEVGAWACDVERMRVAPRARLTARLREADLVFVVAGSPAWAGVAARAGRPVVLQVATMVREERRVQRTPQHGARRLWRAAMTLVVHRADVAALRHVAVALVENAWMEAELGRHMGPARVRLAPPGVDTERFRPARAAEARPVHLPQPGYVLSVGRLADPRKNVGLLVEAYARLAAARPDAPDLVLAGATAPPPAVLAAASQAGLAGRVRVLRDVPADDLGALYRGAAAFALSSDEEGLGLVLLEAMASGVPVVATDCGGPAACVLDGVTGFLTPVGDAAAMAEALGRLLSDEAARRTMGAAARTHVESRFSEHVTAGAFVQACDDTLADILRGGQAR